MVERVSPMPVILGPTATGKTTVAVEIALITGGEIVSADSMLVYKYMNIGTAKPTPGECKGVPHHLIDVVAPDEEFNVARYQSLAEKAIGDIRRRGKQPILAGGTGLYIRAVVDGFQFGAAGIDREFRNEMMEYARREGKEALHKELRRVDPASAARLHPNDQKRIIRALEIHRNTGRPMSAQKPYRPGKPRHRARLFGLYLPREELYRRVNTRVDRMLEKGLEEEVKGLLEMGYHTGLVSLQALGYKEMAACLQGAVDRERAVYLIKRDTRRFAKRQLTWFRRDPRITWINVKDYPGPAEIAREITGQINPEAGKKT